MEIMRAKEIINRLLEFQRVNWLPTPIGLYRGLIKTILSQNTNWKNEDIAYRRLEKMSFNPWSIAESNIEDIANAIKPAGMQNKKSKVIVDVSKKIIEKYNGDLSDIVYKDYTQAREELMKLPGVGKKTADVVLLFYADKKIIPIDRHIERISKRLELVKPNAKYDEIQKILERAVNDELYLRVHLSLIQFGRDICSAKSPKCVLCFLNDICSYPKK